MADHINKQVRDAVITRLTGLTTTGSRVHSYRVNALESITDLPALIVRTSTDNAQSQTVHAPITYQRDIEITVMAYASGNADLDDTLDLIRKEVETAMGTALTVGGKSVLPLYSDSEMDESEGERAAGELQMRFLVSVFHTAAAPDVLL